MDSQIQKKLDTFFNQFRKKIHKKGAVIISAGDNPRGVFYLTKGTVKEYAISIKGDELVVNIFKPIAFFPMSWAINETRNDYFFEAATDITVAIAPRGKVVEFIKSNPDVLYNLMSRVFKGTDGILTKMTYLMAGSAHSRLIAEIIIQSKRFGEKKGDQVELTITEKDLATQLGMSRETVSREIKILKEKSLITFKNKKLLVLNFKALEELSV